LEDLKLVKWEENSSVIVGIGPYGRHAFLIIMSPFGRQTAQFANGEHNYFAVTAVLSGDGQVVDAGGTVIPVFPNGDLLMIVEQRAPLALWDALEYARVLTFSDGREPLELGPCGSVEFPAGAIEPSEGIRSGMLREFAEETEISGHEVLIVERQYPAWPQIAELYPRIHEAIVFLPEVSFSDHVATDGGLSVVRLSRSDFLFNKRRGVFSATHPVLEGWRFLNDVRDTEERQEMLNAGEIKEILLNI
tara:strand:- start:1212 stop:1955 length:744 start_codon:yes stop_codon:yes gene_type:complete